ncbi:MAG: hypothetical protein LAT56_00245 [Wenzhouxiangella sp.]|nr:hypothetical protein [Wenzhouxiangella sp.]
MKTKSIEKHIDQVVSEIAGLTIQTDQQYKEATAFLRDKVKPSITMVKDHFEEDRKKTYAEYKAVTDSIKTYTDRLTAVEKSVKRMLSAYVQEQEKKRIEEARKAAAEAEERRLQEAIETGKEETLEEPFVPEVPKPAVEKEDGIVYVDRWTFEIEDESQIPREYLIVDMQKIRKVVQALKDDAKIAGVKVVKTKEVRVS